MDNQKDFIHIDDLFKNLRNGEDPERSGSWLHMKELLDKEMPLGTTVSAGRSFRRFLIPVLALILASGGGVTYYKLNESSKTPAAAPLAAAHSLNVPAAGGDAKQQLNSGGGRNAVAGKGGAATPNGTVVTTRPRNSSTQETTPRNAASSSGSTSDKGHTQNAATHAVANGKQQQAHDGLARPHGGKSTPAAVASTAATNRGHSTATASNKERRRRDAIGDANASELVEEQRVIEQIKPGSNKSNTPAATAANGNEPVPVRANSYATGNTGVKQLPVALNNKKIVRDNSGNLYKEERDTFKRIDLVERLVASGNSSKGRATYTTAMDTVAVTRVEKVRYVPLDQLELISLRKMGVEINSKKIMPSASLRERTLSKKEIVSLVPLNQYKVASRRVDPGKFNQLIQNTSQGISNYFDGSHNFYAAVLVGGNASFGNPGAFGMQLGIAGLYSLSERLTLAAELKYVNHYFSNYTIEDRSVTFENVSGQQTGGTEWLFSGKQNTTTSAYKLSSFGALEMPVTLSYNLGRLSIFAGLNMAYAFPIKWSKENTFNTTNVQQAQSQNENPFRDATFRVDEQKDFNARFGMGYVWGMSYDVSRNISLDARVSQIVWDNANGNTDAVNRMFRIPTMQFSIGYFFGRKDKVVYIMDKR